MSILRISQHMLSTLVTQLSIKRVLSSVWMSLQTSCKAEQRSNLWTNLGQWDLQWNSLWTWVPCTCAAFDTCHLPDTAWRIQRWCLSHGSFNMCSVSLSYTVYVCGVVFVLGEGIMTAFVLIAPTCSLTVKHGGYRSLLWIKYWAPYHWKDILI